MDVSMSPQEIKIDNPHPDETRGKGNKLLQNVQMTICQRVHVPNVYNHYMSMG